MKKLEWTTVQRKVNDLLGSEINPRKITESRRKELMDSLGKFNLADIPVINADETIISGHQRVKALQLLDRGEETIDVRFPNRLLTTAELKEYMLISNTHAGEWDFDILKVEFEDVNIGMLGIEMTPVDFENSDPYARDIKKYMKQKKELIYDVDKDGLEIRELKPYLLTHILISFPPEKLIEIQEYLEQIKNKEYVEYEQSSN